jgi:hypothetical protein
MFARCYAWKFSLKKVCDSHRTREVISTVFHDIIAGNASNIVGLAVRLLILLEVRDRGGICKVRCKKRT